MIFQPSRHFPGRRSVLGTLSSAIVTGSIAPGIAQTIPGRWVREQIRRGTDPICGAEIRQLTSAVSISHDIYGEQLYRSADGTRIAFLRCATTDHRDGPMELFVADLHQKGVKRIGPADFAWAALRRAGFCLSVTPERAMDLPGTPTLPLI